MRLPAKILITPVTSSLRIMPHSAFTPCAGKAILCRHITSGKLCVTKQIRVRVLARLVTSLLIADNARYFCHVRLTYFLRALHKKGVFPVAIFIHSSSCCHTLSSLATSTSTSVAMIILFLLWCVSLACRSHSHTSQANNAARACCDVAVRACQSSHLHMGRLLQSTQLFCVPRILLHCTPLILLLCTRLVLLLCTPRTARCVFRFKGWRQARWQR
jgi:hypothetical protein